MKKIFLILTVALGLTMSAQAGIYTHQRIGNYDYWSGDNGYSGTGYRIGRYYYYDDNYGSGVGYRIGNYDYYDYTPNN